MIEEEKINFDVLAIIRRFTQCTTIHRHAVKRIGITEEHSRTN